MEGVCALRLRREGLREGAEPGVEGAEGEELIAAEGGGEGDFDIGEVLRCGEFEG